MHNTFILLLVLLYNSAWASSIQGRILNSSSLPISHAQVQIWPQGSSDISDSTGSYHITDLEPGLYRIKISHIAYQTSFIENIRISKGQSVTIPDAILNTNIFLTDETLITATRKSQQIFDVPQAINRISQDRIRKRQPATSADALLGETGLHIQKTNHGGGSATIRGFSANRILILVDGFRMNNSLFRMGNHQYLTSVDFGSLERIEVVRGPASGMYGSDAMGGAINLITTHHDFSNQSPAWQFKINVQGATADNQMLGQASTHFRSSSSVIMASFAYKKFGHLRRGGYSLYPELENSTLGLRQYPSAYSGSDYLLKGIHKLSEAMQIIYAYQASRQWDVPRYDKYETQNYAMWEYEPQLRQLAYLTYEWRPNSKYISYLKTGLSLQRQQEGRIFKKSEQDATNNEEDEALTLGWILQMRSFWMGHDVNYGLDFYSDAISSKRFRTTDDGREQTIYEIPRFPDGANYQSLGGFIQDEKNIFENTSIITSLRLNYYQTQFRAAGQSNDMNISFNALSANLRIVQKMGPKWRLNFNLAKAYRAPNLSDLARFGQSKGNTYEVPNTALKPEQVINLEAGFKYRSTRLSSGLSVYYSYVFDMIERANAFYNGLATIERDGIIMDVKSRQNLGNAVISGLEFHLNYSFEKEWILNWNTSYIYGQNLYLDQPVTSMPPLSGLIGLEKSHDRLNYHLFLRFAASQRRLSADDQDDPRIPKNGSPPWYTINLSMGYALNASFNGRISLENIFDFNYREHGSGINAAGRNLIVSLSYRL